MDFYEEEPLEPWRSKNWRPGNLHHAAAGGLAQMLALHPGMAALTVTVDLMAQSAAVATAGLLIPLSVAAGAVLAWLCYRAQMKWMNDDEEAALIKAVAVGLLTAIPSPLPYAFFIPMGIIGWWRRRR